MFVEGFWSGLGMAILDLLVRSYGVLFWFWPLLFVTQLVRAIHRYPHREEAPGAYRRSVALATLGLAVMALLPLAVAYQAGAFF